MPFTSVPAWTIVPYQLRYHPQRKYGAHTNTYSTWSFGLGGLVSFPTVLLPVCLSGRDGDQYENEEGLDRSHVLLQLLLAVCTCTVVVLALSLEGCLWSPCVCACPALVSRVFTIQDHSTTIYTKSLPLLPRVLKGSTAGLFPSASCPHGCPLAPALFHSAENS